MGYSLLLNGKINDEECEFSIGIGKAAQIKYSFKVGDQISGESMPVADKKKDSVDYYKTSKLEILKSVQSKNTYPPWEDISVELEEYRERGHRRLSSNTYKIHCKSCKWGCLMPVEIIVDHWNAQIKKYRFETFCYGPKSCRFYKPGPKRTVPGRKGMNWEEPDWVDEEITSHRSEDE